MRVELTTLDGLSDINGHVKSNAKELLAQRLANDIRNELFPSGGALSCVYQQFFNQLSPWVLQRMPRVKSSPEIPQDCLRATTRWAIAK